MTRKTVLSYRSGTVDDGSPPQPDVFAALARPVRRGGIERLAGQEGAVERLAAGPDISRPAISRHLRVLVEAGLVESRRAGRGRHHRPRTDGLRTLDAWLMRYRRFWDEHLVRLARVADQEGDMA